MLHCSQHTPNKTTLFFTVTLRDKHATTLVDHIDIVRQSVRRIKTVHPFQINAWVVLPNQMHCIWTLPGNDQNYALRWRLIKSSVSRRLTNRMPNAVTPSKSIWQDRFWEHHIRDTSDYALHMKYCTHAPVSSGLVKNPTDWPYSSVHRDNLHRQHLYEHFNQTRASSNASQ